MLKNLLIGSLGLGSIIAIDMTVNNYGEVVGSIVALSLGIFFFTVIVLETTKKTSDH